MKKLLYLLVAVAGTGLIWFPSKQLNFAGDSLFAALFSLAWCFVVYCIYRSSSKKGVEKNK